jgi:hypothetical protein
VVNRRIADPAPRVSEPSRLAAASCTQYGLPGSARELLHVQRRQCSTAKDITRAAHRERPRRDTETLMVNSLPANMATGREHGSALSSGGHPWLPSTGLAKRSTGVGLPLPAVRGSWAPPRVVALYPSGESAGQRKKETSNAVSSDHPPASMRSLKHQGSLQLSATGQRPMSVDRHVYGTLIQPQSTVW